MLLVCGVDFTHRIKKRMVILSTLYSSHLPNVSQWFKPLNVLLLSARIARSAVYCQIGGPHPNISAIEIT